MGARSLATGLALAVVLSGCGRKEADGPRPTATAKAPRVSNIEFGEKRRLSGRPMTEEQVAERRRGVESAMDGIPPAMRNDFQKAFECQAGRNGRLPPAEQIEMDGDWIVRKTEQIRADRETALAC